MPSLEMKFASQQIYSLSFFASDIMQTETSKHVEWIYLIPENLLS